MKRLILLSIFVLTLVTNVNAQGNFSFYQLREIVPQASNLQPAFIPQNSFSLGLPGLGGVGVTFQGDFELGDLLYKPNGFGDYTVDFDVLLAATNPTNFMNLDVTANLLHLGIRNKLGAFSLFANARVKMDFHYDDDLMEFLANGNSNRIGGAISFDETMIRLNSFHEIGIGYAKTFLNERLTVGARVKMVTGLFHASTAEGATGSIATDADDFTWTVNIQNGTVNTAGLDLLLNESDYPDNALQDYLISNDNSSMAFDIGAKFDILKTLTVEASVMDIGSITWKETMVNYNTADTTAIISGVQLRGLENSDEVLEDSVTAKFRSNETNMSFKTTLAKRTYAAISYRPSKDDRFSFTAYNNHVFGRFEPTYAVSYNRKAGQFTFGVIGSFRGRNNNTNIGFNMAANLGPFQLYLATDNMMVLNKPELRSKADIRFGINLMFGYKKWRNPERVVNLDEL